MSTAAFLAAMPVEPRQLPPIAKRRSSPPAVSYRKVNRDEITGAAPTDGAACGRNGCDEFVAIECTR